MRPPESLPEDTDSQQQQPVQVARVAPQKFRLLFTCKICEHRNSHMISRLAYHQGIVIATCPGCTSRHLISDKTGLLDWGLWDIEMLAQQGEKVTRLTTEGYRQMTGEESAAAAEAVYAGAAARAAAAAEQGLTSPEPKKSEKPPLLIRNKEGLIEAVPEGDVGISGAAEFLADNSDEDSLSTA